MSTLTLSPITGYDSLGGSVVAATGVGDNTGDPIDITHPSYPTRNNTGRTVSIKFTKDTLVGGKFAVLGRIDPTDDDGWVELGSETSQVVVTDPADSETPPRNLQDGDDTAIAILVLGADYRQIRIDTAVTSGTLDIEVAVAS